MGWIDKILGRKKKDNKVIGSKVTLVWQKWHKKKDRIWRMFSGHKRWFNDEPCENWQQKKIPEELLFKRNRWTLCPTRIDVWRMSGCFQIHGSVEMYAKCLQKINLTYSIGYIILKIIDDLMAAAVKLNFISKYCTKVDVSEWCRSQQDHCIPETHHASFSSLFYLDFLLPALTCPFFHL